MTPEPIVALRSISRSFAGSQPVHAIRDAHLVVDSGDYVSVVGPSGSGKSTLLNLIGCLDKPTSGSYHLRGIDTAELGDSRLAGLRGQEIGFVFQSFHLIGHRTALENIRIGMLYNRTPRESRDELARGALDSVGMTHRIDFEPSQLSAGEKQRVAIARALVSRPALLLCDEPTGNLDSQTTSSILDLFEELRSTGLTLIIVTHDGLVSQRAERRVQMIDGVLSEAPS